MKKFLSMLLALSVVFTYTFGAAGSVFAASSVAVDAMNEKVATEKAAMAKALDDYTNALGFNGSGDLKSVPDGTTLGNVDEDALKLTKAAVDAGLAEIKADYAVTIETAGTTAIADGTFTDTDATSVHDAWAKLDENAKITDVLFDAYAEKDKAMYTKAVADAKAALQKSMDAVDASKYSTADAKTINAAKLVATNVLSGAENDATSYGELLNAKTTFETATESLKPVADQESDLAKVKTQAKSVIEAAADAFKVKYKEYLQSVIDDSSSSALKKNTASTKLATADTDVAAVVAHYVAIIDAVKVTSPTATTDIDTAKTKATSEFALGTSDEVTGTEAERFATTVANLVTSKELLVKYANEKAAAMKLLYDATTGLATYNEKTVDAYLNDTVLPRVNALSPDANTIGAIDTLFKNCPTAAQEKTNLGTYQGYGIALITSIATIPTTAPKAIRDIDSTLDYAKTAWDTKYQKDIEAIQDEYTLKIRAAADVDTIVALVKEAREKMDAVALNSADTTSVKASVKAQLAALGYATYTSTTIDGGTVHAYALSKGSAYANARSAAVDSAVDVLYNAVLAKKSTKLTNVEIQNILKENYSAALAVIDGMITDAELDAAEKALVEAIKALPTNATLETKAQYLAVQKQFEDYMDLDGAVATKVTNKGLLTSYMTKIVALEKAAVEAMIKALPKTITVADKAAVDAAEAAMNAYDDAYDEYVIGSTFAYGYVAVSNKADLTTAVTALSSAMKIDAAKKIAALPAVVTLEDKATVEAARAAYDALSAIDKLAFDNSSSALVTKLVAAEAQIAKAEADANKYTDKDAKADLLDMARKITIWRTSKKSIRVTAVGSVSNIKKNGYTVKYTFYKKAPGAKAFKAVKTTTSNKYVYSNLKKGTNKFQVKVKVYDAEGKLVASKTTFYRAAKVK